MDDAETSRRSEWRSEEMAALAAEVSEWKGMARFELAAGTAEWARMCQPRII
jgi:hypothetical protein